jgi:peroxiredoxin
MPWVVDELHESLGCELIRQRAARFMRKIRKRLGADLTQFNGEDSCTLPMPARYVIGPDGRVAYAETNPCYTRRLEPSDVFPILHRLKVAPLGPGRLFERSDTRRLAASQ